MVNCGKCRCELPDGARFCPSCGRPAISSSQLETQEVSQSPPVSLISSRSVDEGRYLPGVMLGGRYRIVSLLGRGGMGEVYRATDVKLGQPVALKFLPESLSRDEKALDRLYAEVRTARQVSHANVCRVYDLGEIEGLAYISMEYVDGEDLSVLLRRIGRLPAAKATELAKQLCAGLAAAHDQGVLHRDLKPSNIMLDARGQLRIMDFGLAGAAKQIGDLRSGTPAYMSPEQLAGTEVTPASDLYSLGLVLYEIFTGRRPFDAGSIEEFRQKQAESSPDSLTSQVVDIDPAVERVILRCIAPDPVERPASARAVLAALPGGDPLRAAMAAGEFPSPELVAAAGEGRDLLPIGWLVVALAVVVIGLVAAAYRSPRAMIQGAARLDLPPEVLAQKGRDLLNEIGLPQPVDSARGFSLNNGFMGHIRGNYSSSERWAAIGSTRPGPVEFWYRESPWYLIPFYVRSEGETNRRDPPQLISGQSTVVFDSQGRLLSFESVAPQVDRRPPATQPEEPDWAPLFRAAQVDVTQFKSVPPTWSAVGGFDRRTAWEGTLEDGKLPVRIEAASWRGAPVAFQLVFPWTNPGRMERGRPGPGQRLLRLAGVSIALVGLFAVIFFARFNMKRGRGDRRGAFRLGSIVFLFYFGALLLVAHHVGTTQEVDLLQLILQPAALFAIGAYFLYLALEPLVRRYWPHVLIAWNRLIFGRWNDPLVGSHILIGLAFGVIQVLVNLYSRDLIQGSGPDFHLLDTLLGGLQIPSAWMRLAVPSMVGALATIWMLFLFRLVLRIPVLATVAYVAAATAMAVFAAEDKLTTAIFTLPLVAMNTLLMIRYGVLAIIAGHFVVAVSRAFYFTLDTSSWAGTSGQLTMLLVLALAGTAFWIALGGRKLVGEKLLD